MFKRQLLINFAQENWSEYLEKTWKILEKHLQLIAVVVKLEAINLSLKKLHFFTSDFLEIFQSFQNSYFKNFCGQVFRVSTMLIQKD